MNKLTVPIVVLMILAAVVCGAAQAEESTWMCPECGETWPEIYSFCPVDKHARPAVSAGTGDDSQKTPETTWECMTCGEKWPEEFNACPNDATDKPAGPWPALKPGGSSVSLKDWQGRAIQRQSYLGPDRGYAQGGAFMSSHRGLKALFRENDAVLVNTGSRCVYFDASLLNGAPEDEITLTAHPAVTTARIQPRLGPGKEYDPLVQKIIIRRVGDDPEQDYQTPPGEDTNPDGHTDYDEGISEEQFSYSEPEDGLNREDGGIVYENGLTPEWYAEHGAPDPEADKQGGKGANASLSIIDIWLYEGAGISVFFESDGWVFAEFASGAGLVRAWIPADKTASGR